MLRELPPPKVFLEVEIFNLQHNLEFVTAFVGKCAGKGEHSYEKFEVPAGAKKDGQIDEWKPIEGDNPNDKVFQTELEDELLKEEKYEEKKTIRIQAKRFYVANEYYDDERAVQPKKTDTKYDIARATRMAGDDKLVEKLKSRKGSWPKDVRIEHRIAFWPTEENLAQIYVYPEKEKAKYDKKKQEEVIATLNKILILQKDDDIEYVADRFVSL